jgi:hypothetical protein
MSPVTDGVYQSDPGPAGLAASQVNRCVGSPSDSGTEDSVAVMTERIASMR